MTWDGALPDAPGGDPWRSLDLAPSVRRLAEEAAAAAGLAVAEWLERAIHDACSKDAPEAPGEPMPAAEPIRPAPPLDPWLAQLLAVTRRLPPMPAPSTESAPPPAAECVPAPLPELTPPAVEAEPPAADAALEETGHAELDAPESENSEPEAAPAPASTESKPMPDLVAKLWSEPAEPPLTAPDPFQNLEQQRLEWRHLLRLEPETSEASEKAPQSVPADAAEQEAPAPEAKPLPSSLIPPPPAHPAAQEQKDLEPAFADVLEKKAGAIDAEAVTLPTPISVPWRPVTAEPEAPGEGSATGTRRPLRLLLALVVILCSLAAGVLTARYLLPNGFSNAGAHQTKVSLILTPPEGSPATAAIASAGTSLSAAAAALPPASSAEPPKAANTDPSLLADRLQQKASGGDAVASFRLGILYALGQGVQKDYPRAAALFRTAAERGVPEAEYNIAVMYGDGMGVERNVTQAIYWYRKAAAQGNPNAAFNLGTAYADGTGVPRNMAAAAHWFRLAAGQGVVNALFNLGLLYERGTGVPASSTEAYAWYAAAAGRGDTGAAHRRDEIAAQFTPVQLTQARARAAALQRSLGLAQQDASASP